MIGMEIEKGIPVPPSMSGGNSEFARLIRAMEPGDSVLLTTVEKKEHARQVMRSKGRKYASRKVAGGWRVWRVT